MDHDYWQNILRKIRIYKADSILKQYYKNYQEEESKMQ